MVGAGKKKKKKRKNKGNKENKKEEKKKKREQEGKVKYDKSTGFITFQFYSVTYTYGLSYLKNNVCLTCCLWKTVQMTGKLALLQSHKL